MLREEGVLELHDPLDDVFGEVERGGEESKRVFEGNQQVDELEDVCGCCEDGPRVFLI